MVATTSFRCILKFMKIGYARVSTSDQDASMQVIALEEAGCARVFVEQASGSKWERVELHRLLDQLRSGDCVTVWKLDRLSRSLKDLLTILEKLDSAKVEFCSLTESIDTSSAAGRAMMRMVGVFAEFERDMIRERTREGLKAARKAGRVGGRPRSLTDEQEAEAIKMVKSGQKSKAAIARLFGVHPSTISRLALQCS
ncbi:MAG: DNA invertase Pin-like site-specific DNA recombinase [Verrucomicrobiales bacterium]|jgi:DNA invertase Pin-like site-specific DNA recombinase